MDNQLLSYYRRKKDDKIIDVYADDTEVCYCIDNKQLPPYRLVLIRHFFMTVAFKKKIYHKNLDNNESKEVADLQWMIFFPAQNAHDAIQHIVDIEEMNECITLVNHIKGFWLQG